MSQHLLINLTVINYHNIKYHVCEYNKSVIGNTMPFNSNRNSSSFKNKLMKVNHLTAKSINICDVIIYCSIVFCHSGMIYPSSCNFNAMFCCFQLCYDQFFIWFQTFAQTKLVKMSIMALD